MTKGHPRDYRWFELHPERTLLVRAPYPSEGILGSTPFPRTGFYPISTDGWVKAENFRSCRATLRRMRGL
jgi:hypothetical protein